MSTNYAPLNPGLPMSGQGLDSQPLLKPSYGVPAGAAPMPVPPSVQPSMPPSAGTPGVATAYNVPAPVEGGSQTTAGSAGGAPSAAPFANTSMGAASTAGAMPQPHDVHPNASRDQVASLVMQALGQYESKGKYDADRTVTHPHASPRQSASGIAQWTDGTWGNYGGYARAVQAPAWVQDQRLSEDTHKNFSTYGGNPIAMIIAHYQPAMAAHPERWNSQPVYANGQQIPHAQTPAQYAIGVLGKGSEERVNSYIAANSKPQSSG